MADLFGRYCYIDTPWIAGKRTRYRIIGNGVSSNAWCEVPVTGRTELIHHDNTEEVVFVVLDTLVSDDSIIRRFALKDVDVIPADVRTVVLCGDCRWFIDTGYTEIGRDIPELRTGHCRVLGRDVHACWFCGAGEQKEDSSSLTESLKRNTTEIEEKANVIRAEYIRQLQEKNKALDEELSSLRETFLQATRGGRVDGNEKD